MQSSSYMGIVKKEILTEEVISEIINENYAIVSAAYIIPEHFENKRQKTRRKPVIGDKGIKKGHEADSIRIDTLEGEDFKYKKQGSLNLGDSSDSDTNYYESVFISSTTLYHIKRGTIVWITPWNTKNTKMLQKYNGKYDLQVGTEFEWYENPSIHRDIILDQKDLEPSGTPDYENFRYLCPQNLNKWNKMDYRLYLDKDGKAVPREMWPQTNCG